MVNKRQTKYFSKRQCRKVRSRNNNNYSATILSQEQLLLSLVSHFKKIPKKLVHFTKSITFMLLYEYYIILMLVYDF